MDDVSNNQYSTQVATVVAAYLGNPSTRVDKGELGDVIMAIQAALGVSQFRPTGETSSPAKSAASRRDTPELEMPVTPNRAPSDAGKQTAAAIRKSITPDHLISFIDGRPYKTLKRHLTLHGYTPASYREFFGLRPDYPMVAPNYSATRSALAKSSGLGRSDGLTPRGPALAAKSSARQPVRPRTKSVAATRSASTASKARERRSGQSASS